MLAATTDAMAGAGNTWCWGRKGPALKLSGENLVMEKVNSSPDYSTVLGTEGFSSGIHTWEMKIEQDTDGVWVGVTTENCKLDTCIVNQSECRSWLYRPSGKCFRYDRGSQRDGPEGMSFRADDTIRLSLDMHAGKISFMNVSKGKDSKVATLGDVEGPVFPCVCFDYGSKVTILSQSTRGGMSWLAAAEAAWHSGMVATDQIALPGASWTQACDEQLCRVLAQAKPKAPTAAALADLTKFPLISGTATGVLLRRARLISRYSELVTGILPLIDLRGTGLPATAAIGQLRSLILPTHKLKFIERVLTSVRGRVSSSSGHPAFKVSRAKTLAGKTLAADGSESIAYQIFNELKKSGAHVKNALYSGRELWWQVEFIGEGVQDCGGGFRDSVNDLADDFMSKRTPLFVPVSNAEESAGTLQDTFVPNPACSDWEHYEWAGRLCAAAILSDESLVLRFPPLVWKLLGGAEAGLEDLEELDASFVALLRNVQTTTDDISMWCMTFSVRLSDGTSLALIPGGHDIDVTLENRSEFVRLATQARLREGAAQVAAMRRGLCAVIPAAVVRLWTAQELELAVCGSPEIPVSVIRDNARFEISADSPRVKFLWEALEEMTNEERSLFLRFVSGRARPPVRIKLQDGGSRGGFPRAATCFNSIQLPNYDSKELMLERLLYAIYNTKTIDTDGLRSGEVFVLD